MDEYTPSLQSCDRSLTLAMSRRTPLAFSLPRRGEFVRGVMLLVSGALIALAMAGEAAAQLQPPQSGATQRSTPVPSGWRRPNIGARAPTPPEPLTTEVRQVSAEQQAADPAAMANRQPIAAVSTGRGGLPSDAGQIWREYDISAFTARAGDAPNPEQAIVDWILRETGYEAWHSEPVGLLSASRHTLTVYHTPQMQAVVGEVADRFVNSATDSNALGLRVITVGHPDWRAKAQGILRPVATQTQGIQAWLIQREDAALLLAEIRKRTDFREHSSPTLLVNNGQSTIVSTTQPRTYVRGVMLRADVWPAFEPEVTQFDEGFSLELSPLMALDGQTIDAVIKCNVDQLEKLVPVMVEVPTPIAPHQRTKIEVPQISHCRVHERFRWPADHILLVGFGVVATPMPDQSTGLRIPLLPSSPSRADLLVFVESKGKVATADGVAPTAAGGPPQYRGRY